MITVWRYEHDLPGKGDSFEFVAPSPGIILTVRASRARIDGIEIWASVLTENDGIEMMRRTIYVVGTGKPIPRDYGEPLGATFHPLTLNGPLLGGAVFHLFGMAPEYFTP